MTALPDVGSGTLAVGWATVELDRAALELAHLLAPDAAFRDAPPSVLLGARCRIAPAAAPATVRIVLLEPDTEGRLAATLARSGEGWVATWEVEPSVIGGAGISAARPGPLGLERLGLEGGPAGTHRLFVEAVPSRP